MLRGLILALIVLIGVHVEGFHTPNALRASRYAPVRTVLRTAGPLHMTEPPPPPPLPPPPPADAPEAEKPVTFTELPGSFGDLMLQLQGAVAAAIDSGEMLVEAEFPPLPTSVLDGPTTSAADISDANIRLAVDLAKKFATGPTPKTVAITLPDKAELDRAIEKVTDVEEPFPGVKLHAMSNALFKGLLGLVLSGGAEREVNVVEKADIYIIIVTSCQELPDIEKLHELDPTKPKVLLNLRLNTLRGDLGLPAFPSKELQRRFLCKIKPVYYMLPRDYTLTINRPPYLLAYSGVLFRVFPEDYQNLLEVGQGKRRQARVTSRRPGLGEFKQNLIDNLKMADGVESISQAGYKTKTWYEEDIEIDELNVSNGWIS